MIRNLLDNAVKYSPGGEVVVRIAGEVGDDFTWVVLAVSDQEIGTPPSDLPWIFERFHRSRNVAGIGGTRIGLAGVKQIVAQRRGTIVAESEVGSVAPSQSACRSARSDPSQIPSVTS